MSDFLIFSPWAHRCLITRSLKGLDNVIGLSIVHPTWQFTRQNNPEDKHSGEKSSPKN